MESSVINAPVWFGRITHTPPTTLTTFPRMPSLCSITDALVYSALAAQRVAGSGCAALCAHSLQVHAYHVAYALGADGAHRGSHTHQEGDGEHTGVHECAGGLLWLSLTVLVATP